MHIESRIVSYKQKEELSPSEAARMIGVTTTTLATWRSRGGKSLPYHKRFGRVFYKLSEVNRFLREQAEEGSFI